MSDVDNHDFFLFKGPFGGRDTSYKRRQGTNFDLTSQFQKKKP